jgi:hypothetical protein
MRVCVPTILVVAAFTAAFGAQPPVLVYPSGDTVPENLLRIELLNHLKCPGTKPPQMNEQSHKYNENYNSHS